MRLKAHILWFGISLCFLVTVTLYVYTTTKESYYDVGYGHGVIDTKNEKIKFFKKILGQLENCRGIKAKEGALIPFMEVKADASIYFIESDFGNVRFCTYD